MGSLGRRRILRARGSTSALIEAAAAAGGEGADRFASAFGRLDAARRRHPCRSHHHTIITTTSLTQPSCTDLLRLLLP